MRIGIFGGTFDPPHIGHLILAAEAYYQLKLERLLWVLTPQPPHKLDRQVTPLEARLEMLQAALAGAPEFELSRLDIDRPPPHYAVDSLNLLRQQYPTASFIYLMGGDSLGDLPTWHRAADFVAACDGLGVMCRPSRAVDLDALEAYLPGISRKVHFLQAPLLQISSSQLRQRIAQGAPYRYYLPPAVYQIITARHLYAEL